MILHRAERNSRPQKTLGLQELETRKLMAADSFEFAFFEQPEVEHVRLETIDLVDELSDSLQLNVPDDVAETHGELLEWISPTEWRQTVDASGIAEFGPVLGQSQPLADALDELVVMDFWNDRTGIMDPEFAIQIDSFVQALDCVLAEQLLGHEGNATDSNLPPQFEDLRQQLGDQGFADWLQNNIEQYGNISGVTEDEIESIVDSGQVDEFERQEQALDMWLSDFHSGQEVPDSNEIPIFEFPQSFELPPEFEQVRQELGDAGFAEYLQSNQGETGHWSGSPDAEASVESALEAWLDGHLAPPIVFEIIGDTNNDSLVDFSDFLTLSNNFGRLTMDGFLDGDFDLSGDVGFQDFLHLSANFGKAAPIGVNLNAGDEWGWRECKFGDKTNGYTFDDPVNVGGQFRLRLNQVTDSSGKPINGEHFVYVKYKFKDNSGRTVEKTMPRAKVEFRNGNAIVTLPDSTANGTIHPVKNGVGVSLPPGK